MLRLISRLSVVLTASFALLLGLVHGLLYDAAYYETAHDFFTQSESCVGSPCFLGVIPGETAALDIQDTLLRSSLVLDALLVDVQASPHHVDWEWNGTQPRYLRTAGRVDVSGNEVAAWLLLSPELTLAQLLIIFGEPQSVGGQFSNVILRYPQYGLLLRFTGDCDTFWRAVPQIEIGSVSPGNANQTLDVRYRELCAGQWP